MSAMYVDFEHLDIGSLTDAYSSDEYFSKVVDFLDSYQRNGGFTSQSSGSTGEPKVFFFEKNRAEASAAISNSFFQITKESHLLLCLDIRFIGSKQLLIRALISGAKVTVVKPSLTFYRELPVNSRFYFISLTPLHIAHLLVDFPDFFQNVAICLIGSSVVSFELKEKMYQLNVPTQFYESYGMTETLSHIAIKNISRREAYFQVLEGYEISVNAESCLEVFHPVILPEKIVTNDIVEWKEPNQLIWKGRKDNVINSSGLKFYPEYLENILSAYIPFRFIIAGEPEKTLGQRLIIIIENQCTWTKAELFENMKRSGLPPHALPKEIYRCHTWVETPSFKPVRKEIWSNRILYK